MSKSTMCYATRYQLRVAISAKKGIYDKNGQKDDKGSKVVSRAYVEARNSQVNNELWIINEVETSRLMALREQNIQKNAIKKQRDGATQADLIDAIKGAIQPQQVVQPQSDELTLLREQLAAATAKLEAKQLKEVPTLDNSVGINSDSKPMEKWSLAELQNYCKENGIKYHAAAKEARLLKGIELHNSKNV